MCWSIESFLFDFIMNEIKTKSTSEKSVSLESGFDYFNPKFGIIESSYANISSRGGKSFGRKLWTAGRACPLLRSFRRQYAANQPHRRNLHAGKKFKQRTAPPASAKSHRSSFTSPTHRKPGSAARSAAFAAFPRSLALSAQTAPAENPRRQLHRLRQCPCRRKNKQPHWSALSQSDSFQLRSTSAGDLDVQHR